MSKEIQLTKGYVTTVDDEDYDRLINYKWHAAICDGKVYARRTQRYGPRCENKSKKIFMHRDILNITDSRKVDHRNGDTLCNERHNLRPCTTQQNNMNQSMQVGRKYKGVYYDKRNNKWYARIKLNKKFVHIGTFNSDIEAAKAYNNYAEILFGEFAKVNII